MPELQPAAVAITELEPTLSQTLELEPVPGPGPALEQPWPPPPVATENGLSREKPQVLVFPPDLVAEQFTLMDAVSAPGSPPPPTRHSLPDSSCTIALCVAWVSF